MKKYFYTLIGFLHTVNAAAGSADGDPGAGTHTHITQGAPSTTAIPEPLQKLLAEKQHELLERKFDIPGLSQAQFIPKLYRDHGIGITLVHDSAHLWPLSYREFLFKHTFLNELINEAFFCSVQCLSLINAKDDLTKSLALNGAFERTRNKSLRDKEFKMFSSLIVSYQEGLHQNKHLVSIGQMYLKHKIREEALNRANENGLLLDRLLDREKERHRADSLQDALWTIVSGAASIMRSITAAIKADTDLQACLKAYDQTVAGCEDPQTKFNKYNETIKEFFATYQPAIKGIPAEELQALELIDLGPEHISKVPLVLRKVVDSEVAARK